MDLAHGIGGAKDLPIPAAYAMAGASAALAVSFIVLALAWRTPALRRRHQGPAAAGRGSPRSWRAPRSRSALRVLGFAFFAYVVWAAVAGPDLLTNPTFGVVYVLLWVGIVPMSLLFGPFYKAVSPLRTIHLVFTRLTGGRPEDALIRLPRWVGYWPAALGLLAFVWLELVYPESTYLSPVRLWFAGYIAIVIVGAALFGSAWFEAADPFEVYSTLVGPPVDLRPHSASDGDGPSWCAARWATSTGCRSDPGLVGVVAVLFGSTAFDSFKDSNRVAAVHPVGQPELDLARTSSRCCCSARVVGVTFAVATMPTGVEPGIPRRTLPNRFAHSVVPIIVGYIVAHYLSYFVEVGQQTIAQAQRPDGRPARTCSARPTCTVNYWLSAHPTFLAVLKVLSVVTGHVLGVIAAHDRAIKLLPEAPPAHRSAAAAGR